MNVWEMKNQSNKTGLTHVSLWSGNDVNSTDNYSFCNGFDKINTLYILPPVYAFNVLFNFVSFIILHVSELNWHSKSNYFKYLKAEAFVDVLIASERLIDEFVLDCTSCSFRWNFYVNLTRILLNDYLKQVFNLLALLIQIACTFNRYLDVRNMNQCLLKYPVRVKLVVLVLFSCCVYLYTAFKRTVVSNTVLVHDQIVTVYNTAMTSFGQSSVLASLEFFIRLCVDYVCVIVYTAINGALLVEYRRAVSNAKKNKMQNVEQAEPRRPTDFEEQLRIVKLALFIGLVNLVGRVPYFFNYLAGINVCYKEVTKIVFYASLLAHFFVYYCLNDTFRMCCRRFADKFVDFFRISNDETDERSFSRISTNRNSRHSGQN